NTQFIPIAIDEIVFLGDIPEECYVYTQAKNLANANNEIAKFDARVVNKEGKVIVHIKGLTLRNLTSTKNIAVVKSDQVEDLLKERLSASIGLPPAQIESDVELEHYGINSVMIVDLNRVLGEIFGNLSKTLFFEYKNIKDLAQYFIANHQHVLNKILSVNNQVQATVRHEKKNDQDVFVYDTNEEDIAIIGVGGRYPQAQSLVEFWDNLKAGKDSITDMPKWRFDYDKFLLSTRWGGFIDDIDKFDPQFFNISPREAALIDPQERLFLEVAWETIENAGYNQESLRDRSIGVFVGALWQSYLTVAAEQTAIGNPQMPSGLLYNIPNRVSFFFDWSGPSLAIDTACSSSLSALHFACESVKRGECESALVGGVNLSFSASKYLWLANNNFLSSDGKCRSFGSDGDGYVPGEGVGAVYIKKLSAAIRDNDNILAVIKATSVNHGGKTNGYTVPNPNRQADLIMNSIDKSKVSIDRITYIEAHGTGTSLGDPIEISGINKAFSKYSDKHHRCAIGSVKSNIGHLEAAAGIAGLTKILLQMKYKKLVPSLHASNLNPNIDFEHSSLKVQTELSAWEKLDSGNCAMISSFGAGGSNAHVIVEEYRGNGIVNSAHSTDHFILPLSANDTERLQAYVKKILHFLEIYLDEEMSAKGYLNSASYLRDFTYTFQVARRQMNERLVIIAKNLGELKSKLNHYLDSPNTKLDGIHSGNIKDGQGILKLLSSDEQLTKVFDSWITNRSYAKIAEIWIGGITINWELLYASNECKRIEVPTYPFKKERFWIKEIAPMNNNNQPKLHPLLHQNTSDLFEQKYSSSFETNDLFLMKSKILPNIVSLELVNEAIKQATRKT
ncbi:MAG: polyketide synthase, partial [Gammaproteobacteria bacterium]